MQVVREAWHEVGHLAVAFYLSKHSLGAKLRQGNQQPQVVLNPPGPHPSTPEDWLNTVAYSFGGRAAVEYAISVGAVMPAQPGVEVKHGLDGFLPGSGTPSGQSDYDFAVAHSGKVVGWTSYDSYCEGYERARECIRTHSAKIANLVDLLLKQGQVSHQETTRELS